MSELEIYRPFGPLIGKVTIPENIVKELNDACTKIAKDKQKLKKGDMSQRLAGSVTHEWEIPSELIKTQAEFWGSILSQYVNNVVGSVDAPMFRCRSGEPVELQTAWFNRYFAGDYQPSHYHPEATLSLTGFLKVPNWDKELRRAAKNKGRSSMPGQLIFTNGSVQEWSSHMCAVQPVVGEAYIFPATMLHSVYPYRTKGERRSFAMNFGPIRRDT